VTWGSRRDKAGPDSGDDQPSGLTAEEKLVLVAERLNEMYGPWTLEPGPVLRGPGEIAIRVGADHTGSPKHLDLNIVLESTRPVETTVSDCATGLAAEPEDAIRRAVGMWADTTMTTVLELFSGRGQFADHFDGTQPGSFPGWHSIAGGVIGWGVGENRGALQRWLLDNPPWAALSPAVTDALDPDNLNGVKVFIAARSGYEIAEVRINGKAHGPATEALNALDWPRTTELSAVRTFMLLAHPNDQTPAT
jgi:hypothetical protein